MEKKTWFKNALNDLKRIQREHVLFKHEGGEWELAKGCPVDVEKQMVNREEGCLWLGEGGGEVHNGERKKFTLKCIPGKTKCVRPYFFCFCFLN